MSHPARAPRSGIDGQANAAEADMSSLLILPDLFASSFVLSLSKHSPSTGSGRTVLMFNSCRNNSPAWAVAKPSA